MGIAVMFIDAALCFSVLGSARLAEDDFALACVAVGRVCDTWRALS